MNEIDIRELLPSSDEGKLEFFKELNRHEESMSKIDASVKIEEEYTSQKKYDSAISFGDAIKAFAPVILAIITGGAVISDAMKNTEEAENDTAGIKKNES